VTSSSPLGTLISSLQALFIRRGASPSDAYAAAIQEVIGLVQQQATALAMQDAFRISMLLALVAVVAAFFVRSRRAQPAKEKPLSKEEAGKRDEAMLAA